MEPEDLIAKLQHDVTELTNNFDDLSYTMTKKTGSGSNEIQGAKMQSVNFVSGSSGWELTPDGNLEANNGNFRGDITGASGTFSGTVTVGSLNIPDSVTANSMHVDSSGNTWWGANVASGSAAANAAVLATGAATFKSVTLTGSVAISGIANNTSTDISLLPFSHNLVFSSASATQINWTSGTIVMSNGRTFSISSGNTGAMAAVTFIYLDTAASTTVLQTTTTYSTATGANKIIIATAQNNTAAASVIPFGGGTPLLDGVGNILANSITAASVLTLSMAGKSCTFDTGTIGGFSMAATTLSATNLTLTSGTANAANIAVGTGANLAGMNAGNSGTDIAFWSGATYANRATAPFRVNLQGDVTMTSATISGYVLNTSLRFGGTGANGPLSITSGTTTTSLASALNLIKNYSSISITGTGALVYTTPHTNGSIVILKSSGAITLTSSATPMLSVANCGAAGVAGAVSAGSVGSTGSGNVNSALGGTGGALNSTTVSPGGVSPLVYGSVVKTINLVPGGGGGSGGTGGAGNGGTSSVGGGALLLECVGAFNFTTASGVSVAATTAGSNGSNAGGGQMAGGGGGGGGAGTFIALYNTLTAASGTVTVSGATAGSGGTGGGAGTSGAGGGGGAGAGANGTAGGGGSAGGGAGGNGGDGGDGVSIMQTNNDFV